MGNTKHLISDSTETIHFYFMPKRDYENIQTEPLIEPDDILFVRPYLKDREKEILYACIIPIDPVAEHSRKSNEGARFGKNHWGPNESFPVEQTITVVKRG